VKLTTLFDGLENVFQSHSMFALGREIKLSSHQAAFSAAQDAYLHCLSHKRIKHLPSFVVEHADEYTSFVVFLAQSAYQNGDQDLALAAYLVNRRINGFDCYYTRALPPVFHLEHPLGSVIGGADFGNYLVVYQGVSVGGDMKLRYPTFGEYVALFSHSSVIGNSVVGRNTAIGAGVQIYSEQITENTAVSLRSNQIVRSSMNWSIHDRFFK